MSAFHVATGIALLGLAVYLVIALLFPEKF
jgi:K+-transporting ATPase KdpF subunit